MTHGPETVGFALFLIFGGATIMATVSLFTRQSILVGYILLGIILGPWGMKLIPDSTVIDQTGDVGIMFLLFLLGLHLHPQKLLVMFGKTIWIAVISSIVFAVVTFGVAKSFGFTTEESWIIGAAMMFSSTIVGLKLLPTTVLHHQHTGEVVISVLLLQDIIAIITLLLLHGMRHSLVRSTEQLLVIIIALPALLLIGYLVQRFILIKLIEKFDRIHEYIFLLSIGWCLAMVELSEMMGLSSGIGAFIAGVSLAAHPISQYIAENLKPLRDFFLILFFFSIGAHFDFHYLPNVIIPAVILAAVMLLIKPITFKLLLSWSKEPKKVGWEVGWRLGQASEFSLLIAYFMLGSHLLSVPGSYLIQATTILTFVASSYIVVLFFPTPLAFSEKLRRD